MSRKRMIDPEIWTDEGFIEMSIPARLLFIGMISNADDEGRGVGSAKSLKAKVFSGDDITVAGVEKLKAEVKDHTRTRFYDSDGGKYYQLDRWKTYQTINRPTSSHFPAPEEITQEQKQTHESLTEDSLRTHGGLTEDSLNAHDERKGKEIDEKKRREERANPEEPGTDYQKPEEQAVHEPTPQAPVLQATTTPLQSPWMYTPLNPGHVTEPDDSDVLLGEWYKRFNREMKCMSRSSPSDRARAQEVLESVGSLDAALMAVTRYFDHWREYWFSVRQTDSKKAPGARRPDFRFGSFASNIAQLVVDSRVKVPVAEGEYEF